MIVGLAQIDISWENPKKNMEKAEEFIKKAVKNSVELILFPEMALTGFSMDISKLLVTEQEIVIWLKNIAIDNQINVGLGFAVKADDKGKNKYIIISKDGEVLANYTKIHPFSYAGEDEKYHKGNEVCICMINEFKISPFICYDLRFPYIFEIASSEAHIITVAANWPQARREHWITLLKARAIENQCYVVGINRVGNGNNIQYDGESVFVSPNGEILNEIKNSEALIIEELKMDKITEVKDIFDLKKDRRKDIDGLNDLY